MAIDRGDPNYGTGTGASTNASEISVTDSGSNYTGTDVEAVLAEISDNHIENTSNPHAVTAAQVSAPSLTNLASTSNGQGASLVGVEDSGAYFTGTDVEAVLAELGASLASYAGLYGSDLSANITTIGTTAQKVTVFDTKMPESGSSSSVSTDEITIGTSGDYLINFQISFSTVAVGDAGTYEFHLRKDALGAGSDVETYMGCHREMSGSSDTGSAGFSGIIALSATDQINIYIESDNGGNSDDITVIDVQFSATLIKAS